MYPESRSQLVLSKRSDCWVGLTQIAGDIAVVLRAQSLCKQLEILRPARFTHCQSMVTELQCRLNAHFVL